MQRLARADPRDRTRRLGGERREDRATQIEHLNPVPPRRPRGLELLMQSPERVEIRSLGDAGIEHGDEIEVAAALMEAAGGKRAEEVQAHEPAAEVVSDGSREL